MNYEDIGRNKGGRVQTARNKISLHYKGILKLLLVTINHIKTWLKQIFLSNKK